MSLPISIPNFRDLGGCRTAAGRRVRRGLVYRSTDLARLTPDGERALVEVGIRCVVDLRSSGERDAYPDVVPAGCDYVVADVLADSPGPPPIGLAEPLRDPVLADRLFGNGQAVTHFIERYREFVWLPSARAAYGRLLGRLVVDAPRPLVFHCTTGKDRTGWAAALLLHAVGVPDEVVLADYLASEALLAPAFAPHVADFVGRGGDPEVIAPVIGVRAEYLAAAFEAMTTGYGSVDAYLERGLALGPGARERLTSVLLEPAAEERNRSSKQDGAAGWPGRVD